MLTRVVRLRTRLEPFSTTQEHTASDKAMDSQSPWALPWHGQGGFALSNRPLDGSNFTTELVSVPHSVCADAPASCEGTAADLNMILAATFNLLVGAPHLIGAAAGAPGITPAWPLANSQEFWKRRF